MLNKISMAFQPQPRYENMLLLIGIEVPQLVDALNGRVRAHHRKMIRRHYDHLKQKKKLRN